MSYEITLKNCAFYGYHGALAEEKKIGQRFFIDAELAINSQSYKTDELATTVNYAEAFAVIEKTATKNSYDLIETLAYEIGKNLCQTFSQIENAKITVRKPSVPIAGILDYVETKVCYKNE